jgi:hypothetical protein
MSRVCRLEPREVIAVCFDGIGELEKQAAALVRWELGPSRGSSLRRLDGKIDIFGARLGNARDDRAIEGIDDVDLTTSLGINPCAVDEKAGFERSGIDGGEFWHAGAF